MSHATMRLAAFLLTFASAGALPAKAQYKTLNGKAPLVIAHRGASGYLPEHTLAAYAKAIEMGADVIEPDLVVTKDGVLVVRHEPMLSGTTDIADRPEFAARKTTRILDGIATTDWFACDFTVDELRALRAKQAFAERDQSHNGKYPIPTFQDVIDLVKKESAARHRTIAIYPETKHPTFHHAVGLPMEDRLVESLKAAGWTDKDAPVFIQSFEVSNLKYLRTRIQVRLVQLIDADGVDKNGAITLAPPSDRPYDFTVTGDRRLYPDLLTDAGLKDIKSYADGIGPWKPYIVAGKQIDANGDGKPDDLNKDGIIDERDRVLLPAGDLIERAHKAGLFVHSWTFRNEPRRLASDYKGDPLAEYKQFFALGIDGLFSDFPDTAVKARP